MEKQVTTSYAIAYLILAVGAFIAMPIISIIAWNILFGSVLMIPVTFATWGAALFLGIFVRGVPKAIQKEK